AGGGALGGGARRGDQRPGPGDRGPHRRQPAPPRLHHAHHRPPAVHDPRLRRDHRPRARARGAARHARVAHGRSRWPVRQADPDPMTDTALEPPAADAPQPVEDRALRRLFEAAGAAPVAFQRGDPLDVADPSRAWAVLEGKVDVFFVGPPDAAGISRRTFLLRAEAGGVIFGLSLESDRPPRESDERTVYGLRSGFGIVLAE